MTIGGQSDPGLNKLELVTDPPPRAQAHFLPGDIITGNVTITSPFQASKLGLAINLVGVSRVRFKEKNHFLSQDINHECEVLRIQTKPLTKVEDESQLSWTFSIGLPPTAQPTLSNRSAISARGSQDFASDIGHPLPPTFGGGLKEGFVYQSDTESPEKNVTIAYHIHAFFDKPFHTHPYKGPLSCSTTIRVSTLPFHDANEQKHQIVISELTLPRNHLPGTPQQVPNPNLRLQTFLPTTLPASSANLDIKLCLSHGIPDYLTDKLPAVTMQTFTIDLLSKTLLRDPTTTSSSIWPREAIAHFSHAHQLAQLPLVSASNLSVSDTESQLHNRSILLAGPTELAEWSLPDLLPSLGSVDISEIPTFKTFNVARTYQLRLTCNLEFQGQELTFEATRPLIITPDDADARHPSTADAIIMSKEEEARMDVEEAYPAGDQEAPPPPYQHDPTVSSLDARHEPSGAASEQGLPSYDRTI